MKTLLNIAATAVVASLRIGTPMCASIERLKQAPVSQSVPLAVVVRPLRADPLERNLQGMPIRWAIHVEVEAYARATGTTSADEVVDPLVMAIYQRLAADPTLGGAVIGTYPDTIALDFDVDGERTVCATLNFSVHKFDQSANFSQE